MKKRTKILLVIASLSVILGCFIFVGVMSILKWDFKQLSTVEYQTNVHEITQTFDTINVQVDTADVVFEKTDGATVKVVCFEEDKILHDVTVNDGVLKIECNDTRKWYELLNFSFERTKVTLQIPAGQYGNLKVNSSTGDLQISSDFTFESMEITHSTGNVTSSANVEKNVKITTSTGDIALQNVSAESFDLTVSTGDITLSNITCNQALKVNVSTGDTRMNNVTCNNLISNGDTGDITLTNVIALGKFEIERDTGDVTFNRCDAGEIYVQTDTGDVEGSLLTSKVFVVQTDTGTRRVPNTTTGGRCEITTDTGDIEITLVS